MAFAKEMLAAKEQLEQLGHAVFVPEYTEDYARDKIDKINIGGSEGTQRKRENDLIRKHCELINRSDAILVLNYEKRGIPHYIGGNSFLEIGYAHIVGRKIFLMNEIPDIELIRQEIDAIQPTILRGNLSLIA
jgi:hypothetical protein